MTEAANNPSMANLSNASSRIHLLYKGQMQQDADKEKQLNQY